MHCCIAGTWLNAREDGGDLSARCENKNRHFCLTVLCGCIQFLNANNNPFGRGFGTGRISALLANSTSTELLINDEVWIP